MSVLNGILRREIGNTNRIELTGLKLQMEKWLENEWMFESGYMYALYSKTFELARLFSCAKLALHKILTEEDILKSSLVCFIRRLEGLSENYDYEYLFDEIMAIREEIIMQF